MAERRMFAKTIIDSDNFLDMPLSTQALYFHLSMRADDDGFINNPKKILRMIGCAEDDLKLLIAKNFIIPFDSGIVVIKHWKIHNYIRKDRYNETVYQEEKSLLEEKNNVYIPGIPSGIPSGIPHVNQAVYHLDTQDRLGKDRIGKDRIGEDTFIDSSNDKELSENKSAKKKKEFDFSNQIKEIIDYLNLKAETTYRPKTKDTQQHINARLKEGFTVDDFKTVIDKKCKEWKGTEWEKYLRPSTLFGIKFENYLNQKEVINQKCDSYQNQSYQQEPKTEEEKRIAEERERDKQKYLDMVAEFNGGSI